jgi:hypothetical protein
MTTSNSTRERRDWTLLIFLIPIGIIFMLVAGQVAIRLVPIWSINAGMQSNLDPNNLPMQQSGPLQPILPAILTPMGWLDTFLTPGTGTGNDIVFPPFIVFHPTITPVITTPPPTATVVVTPSPTIIPSTTSPTVVVTPTVASTKNPPTSTPPTPTPTNTLTSTPTNTPTSTPTNTPTPTPTTVPVTSTPPASYTLVTPIPAIDVGLTATPDGTASQFPAFTLATGAYTVIDISGSPIVVSTSPDGYDLIFYESLAANGISVNLDQIIIGISNSPTGSSYYEVFNWGNNIPDTNTNVNTNTLPPDTTCTGPSAPECDNTVIPTTSLYTDPATGINTGILINVDTAPSAPPEGTYNYLVIISPPSGDSAQVDAVVIIP